MEELLGGSMFESLLGVLLGALIVIQIERLRRPSLDQIPPGGCPLAATSSRWRSSLATRAAEVSFA